jgi:hypothetical protein
LHFLLHFLPPCPVAAVQAPQLRTCIVPPPPPPPLLRTVVPAVQLNPDAPVFVPMAPQQIQPSSRSLDERGLVVAAVASSSAGDAPCNHGGSSESVPATSPISHSVLPPGFRVGDQVVTQNHPQIHRNGGL